MVGGGFALALVIVLGKPFAGCHSCPFLLSCAARPSIARVSIGIIIIVIIIIIIIIVINVSAIMVMHVIRVVVCVMCRTAMLVCAVWPFIIMCIVIMSIGVILSVNMDVHVR